MSIHCIKNTIFFCIIFITTNTAMVKTAATFTTAAFGVAALRTVAKMSHQIAVDVDADMRDIGILQSRYIETPLVTFKIHVRKCLQRIVLAAACVYCAQKTGSALSMRTKTILYGAAAGSAITIGR